MVTSNNFPEKKVYKMSEKGTATGVPHRTLLGEVNAHLTCFICRGYYIDATTIVECLHSFCRSCIIKHLQVKSYCPVCEMMINSAKPNIKPDKALQDIVYKLVPGLFQKEMERRRKFYASRPGPAASATPEQRGEDTERIIFSPEDVISFSLEYADGTDSDSISSKSSDSSEQQLLSDSRRRYLQCPAVVNVSHLKKFLCMKFDIDGTQYSLDILYKRIPLPEYYTLMDIAYIYNWKRNKPLRFVYQVMDYLAMRNRYSLFDIKRKKSKCYEIPSTVDDIGPDSPSLLTEHGCEASSGTDSPMPDDINIKKCEIKSKLESGCFVKSELAKHKHSDEDKEKSQFLNSFELTAKNNSTPEISPTKFKKSGLEPKTSQVNTTNNFNIDDNLLKRKHSTPLSAPDDKIKKTINENIPYTDDLNNVDMNTPKETEVLTSTLSSNPLCTPKENMQLNTIKSTNEENKNMLIKRPVPGAQNIQDNIKPILNHKEDKQKVSPIKIQLPKFDVPSVISKPVDSPKPTLKKIPDLKLGNSSLRSQLKVPHTREVRMDLLANNCDPTMDRSKILPHMRSPLPSQSPTTTSGDPLKSLFDSCKINIPSSLSITLSDQKLISPMPESMMSEGMMSDTHIPLNINSVNNHKVSSPPVHNYIEILKLPEMDPIQTKIESCAQYKIANVKKIELPTASTLNNANKQSDTPSSKGPIPSLKPIGETKLSKQTSNFPITSPYQQKYIQSLEQSKATSRIIPKVKMQVPNLMPANVKQLSAAVNKECLKVANNTKCENKPPISDVLDLSTSHNFLSQQSQLGPQQTKTLATMQAIANIANKQTNNIQQNAHYSGISNSEKTPESSHLSIPIMNQIKTDKSKISPIPRQDNLKSLSVKQSSTPCPSLASSVYQLNPTPSTNSNPAISLPRQARSPSSSPKLVIAEEKHALNICDQSNQISSTKGNIVKYDPQNLSPGPSKISFKRMKPASSSRHPVPNSFNKTMLNTTTSDLNIQPPMYPQVMLRHLEWFKTQQARHQYQNLIKNIPNLKQNHQDFNKDKP